MAKTARFKTLTHEGPQFPDVVRTYGYKFRGEKLADYAEYFIYQYAGRIGTDWIKPQFEKNFVPAINRFLSDKQKIKMLSDLDPLTDQMRIDIEARKEEKKVERREMSKAEREAEKKTRDERKEKFGFATVDGERIPINGYLIEQAGILFTRGADPRLGCIKLPVTPDKVRVNIVGDKKKIAEMEKKGFKVVSDNKLKWVFAYSIEIVGAAEHAELRKKVNFGAASDIAAKDELKKYDKALVLLQNWQNIANLINVGLQSDDEKKRQCAACLAIIKLTGIRAGSDRNLDDFADTEGAAILKVGAFTFKKNWIFNLKFLGKDSMLFDRDVYTTEFFWKKLYDMASYKKPTDQIFDKISSADVGNYLKQVDESLTCKTFRSAIGTATLCEELNKNDYKGLKPYQIKSLFVQANLEVGKALNHQKTVAKGYEASAQKRADRLEAAEIKMVAAQADEPVEIEKLRSKIGFAKQAGKADVVKNLKARIEKVRSKTAKAIEAYEKIKSQAATGEKTKAVNLNTSLNSYCAPTVVMSWCKDVGLDPSNIYSKAQLAKFTWAEAVEKDYWKSYLGYLKS
jgi:DNA topoisomerase-1